MSRPLGTYVAEEPPARRRFFEHFFTLFLCCAVLFCCSAFYRYGEILEQQIKSLDGDIASVAAELKQFELAARVVRETRAQDKALNQKLAKAYKLKRRKR